MKRVNLVLSLILPLILSACGYNPDSVKVLDVYEGKKVQVLDRLSEEDKELYQRFIVRKVMKVAFVLPNGEVYDQYANKLAVTEVTEWVDGNTTKNVVGNITMLSKVLSASHVSVKDALGKTTLQKAVEEQKEFEKNEVLGSLKLSEEKLKLNDEVSKIISVKLKSKTTEPVSDFARVNRFMDLNFEITNNGDKAIDGFVVLVQFNDIFGETLVKTRLRYEDGIAAKETVSFPAEVEVNLNKNGNRRFLENDLSKVNAVYSFEKLVYKKVEKQPEVMDKTKTEKPADAVVVEPNVNAVDTVKSDAIDVPKAEVTTEKKEVVIGEPIEKKSVPSPHKSEDKKDVKDKHSSHKDNVSKKV